MVSLVHTDDVTDFVEKVSSHGTRTIFKDGLLIVPVRLDDGQILQHRTVK